MQGEVIRLRMSAGAGPQDDPSARPGQISGYILDMVEQLAALAEQNGEPLLAAMLNEVGRRQQRLSSAQKPSQATP